jgi:hypothetical protein
MGSLTRLMPMYLLVSIFNSAPWLKLVSSRLPLRPVATDIDGIVIDLNHHDGGW